MADELTKGADRHQQQGEAAAHNETVENAGADGIARREYFGSRDDRAVSDDQRNKNAERAIKIRKPGLEDQLDAGHEARDDQDVDWNTYFGLYPSPRRRHQRVRCHQHGECRQTQTQTIDERRRNRQQWAEAEELHEPGIVLPEPGSKSIDKTC